MASTAAAGHVVEGRMSQDNPTAAASAPLSFVRFNSFDRFGWSERKLAGFLLIPCIEVRYRQFVRLGGLIS
jgi:hypothetical protein